MTIISEWIQSERGGGYIPRPDLGAYEPHMGLAALKTNKQGSPRCREIGPGPVSGRAIRAVPASERGDDHFHTFRQLLHVFLTSLRTHVFLFLSNRDIPVHLQTSVRGNWSNYRIPVNSLMSPEISVRTKRVSCRYLWKTVFSRLLT